MHSIAISSALTLALICSSGSFFGVANAALPELTPTPQQMRWTSGAESQLVARAIRGVVIDAALPVNMAALDRLSKALHTSLSPTPDGNLKLVLGALPATIPDRNRREAYILVVDRNGATLTAETAHGIHHGLISLALLADPDKGLPCVTISDWPDQQIRGTYVPGVEQAEARFDQFVALKLNLLLLEDPRLYDLDNPETCARFQRLAERCRANFIDFVPELQSLGWGQAVLEREPRAVEARRVQRLALPVRDGRVTAPAPTLPPPLTIANASFEAGLDAWTLQTYYERWNPSTSNEAQVIACHDVAGGHALQMTLSNKGTVRAAQELAVQAHARYRIHCRIKTHEVEGDGAYLEVYGIDAQGAGTLIGQNNVHVRGTTDWHESSVVIDTSGQQPARPGGALENNESTVRAGYDRICIYVRLQDAVGTAWFDAVEAVPMQSPHPLANVVVTDRAQVKVEPEDGGTHYEEGRDYTLEVPELRYPFAPGVPMQVILTSNSRIQNGDTVLLTFNQATLDDVTCCPSEPLYDEFMRKSIATVVQKLNPDYLHIGHDEPRFFNRDQRCADRQLSNAQLFADAIKRIYESAKAANPQLRIMVWDDALNPYQNGPHLDTSGAAKLLPRDIIINVWWYDISDMDVQLDQSVAYFMELGFATTGSPWFRIPNARRWAELYERHKHNPQALGLIYTSWGGVPDPWAALEFTAEHAWSFGPPKPAP